MKIPPRPDSVPKKRIALIVAIALGVIVLLIAAGIAGAQIWYSENLKPVSSQPKDIVLTIETGTPVKEIGQQLEKNGVIRSARAFEWYTTRQGVRGKLQAGTYKFSPNLSTKRITQMLTDGEVDTSYVTILSGKRLDELTKDFQKAGFSSEDIKAGLEPNQYRSHRSLKDLPEGQTLEGYVYPEKFQILTTSTVKDIVERSLAELDAVFTPDMEQKLSAQGFNFHQAVTLASIIEKETSTLKDRPIVSQVFQKRLKEDMPLGSDVTFIYAAAITGQEATPGLDSPYNTRKVKGLPPGPISNFTLSSLEAVASPATSDYLYFVAGDDGTTYYGKTIDEHNKNISAHCTKLCQ